MIPTFHDYPLEPKLMKCGDLLYHYPVTIWSDHGETICSVGRKAQRPEVQKSKMKSQG